MARFFIVLTNGYTFTTKDPVEVYKHMFRQESMELLKMFVKAAMPTDKLRIMNIEFTRMADSKHGAGK